MANQIKTATYTTAKGKTFPSITAEQLASIVAAATGLDVARVVIPNGSESVLLFPPKAPQSKAKVQDAKASKGPASAGVSLTELQAQIAALTAAMGAMVPAVQPVETARKGRGRPAKVA